MGQALYRKYRSKSFGDVVGQDHITTTLSNALKQGNISHAYLFTGPRGVGKTSVARILAHEVNGLAYEDEATHLDIIEIDAASNRRIDEIRELRQRVHTAPASAKYKVYIIDEVHMLTREAFNALLKTLEEPPAHVIFILATTEAHKLPETIISRTQRFSFKPIDNEKTIGHLKNIAKVEKIEVEDSALELIAEHGGGSFRDSIGLLDQLRGLDKRIASEDVQALLGIPPAKVAEELLFSLKNGDRKQLLMRLNQLTEQGFLATQVAKQLAAVIRNGLIEGQSILTPESGTALLRQLLEVPASHDPNVLLEIILLSTPAVPTGEKSSAQKQEEPPKHIPAPPVLEKKPEPEQTQPTAKGKAPLNDELWHEALQLLRQKHNTLYSIARMATPRFEVDELILVFGFPFHQKRLNEVKNKQIIAQIVNDLSGATVSITCELNPDHKQGTQHKPEVKTITTTPLDNISNIFSAEQAGLRIQVLRRHICPSRGIISGHIILPART